MSSSKDFISDGLDTPSIVDTIKKIRKVIEGGGSQSIDDKRANLMVDFKFFCERYPMLFDMAVKEESFDWHSFNYFINMRNKVINDELTSEKASVIVGQNWYDKHIKIKEDDKNKKRKL
jgi:hypothetical protein